MPGGAGAIPYPNGMLRLARPASNEGGWFQRLLMFVGVSLLSGVLIAGMALPLVELVSNGAANSAEAMKKFPH